MTFLLHHTGRHDACRPCTGARGRDFLVWGGVKQKLRHCATPEFLCSVPKGRFFVLVSPAAPRAATVKDHRRRPPKAAQVLDGGEHGAKLKTHQDYRFHDLTRFGNTTEGSSPWDADIASQPCIRWIHSFGSRP